MNATAALQLADWRRQISELYAQVRALGGGERGWDVWREGKQRLYREHPQSPVALHRREGYVFRCYDYDASMRVLAVLVPSEPRHVDGDAEVPGMTRIGTLRFTLHGADHELGASWLDGYAGGVFVPFADTTSGSETYGGGRYVLDSAKEPISAPTAIAWLSISTSRMHRHARTIHSGAARWRRPPAACTSLSGPGRWGNQQSEVTPAGATSPTDAG